MRQAICTSDAPSSRAASYRSVGIARSAVKMHDHVEADAAPDRDVGDRAQHPGSRTSRSGWASPTPDSASVNGLTRGQVEETPQQRGDDGRHRVRQEDRRPGEAADPGPAGVQQQRDQQRQARAWWGRRSAPYSERRGRRWAGSRGRSATGRSCRRPAHTSVARPGAEPQPARPSPGAGSGRRRRRSARRGTRRTGPGPAPGTSTALRRGGRRGSPTGRTVLVAVGTPSRPSPSVLRGSVRRSCPAPHRRVVSRRA